MASHGTVRRLLGVPCAWRSLALARLGTTQRIEL